MVLLGKPCHAAKFPERLRHPLVRPRLLSPRNVVGSLSLPLQSWGPMGGWRRRRSSNTFADEKFGSTTDANNVISEEVSETLAETQSKLNESMRPKKSFLDGVVGTPTKMNATASVLESGSIAIAGLKASGTMKPEKLLEVATKYLARNYFVASLVPTGDAGGGGVHDPFYYLSLQYQMPDLQQFSPTQQQCLFGLWQGVADRHIPAASKPLPYGCLPVDSAIKVRSVAPDGSVEFRVRKDPNNDKGQVVEVWQSRNLVRRHVVPGSVFRAVYDDSIFGRPSWSRDNQQVVFVAEAPQEMHKSYWGSSAQAKQETLVKDTRASAAHKFRLEPTNDFGELCGGKVQPRIVVFEWTVNRLHVLKIPNWDEQNTYPAQPVFDGPSGRGLVFVGYHLQGFKYGLSACLNRPTKLYHVADYSTLVAEAKGGNGESDVRCLTSNLYFAAFPRFTSDYSRLAFASRQDSFLGHISCLEISTLQWDEDQASERVVVLPRVKGRQEPSWANKTGFLGLYGFHDGLEKMDWLDVRHIVFQTWANARTVVYVLDTEDMRLERLDPAGQFSEHGGSVNLLATRSDAVVVATSSLTKPSETWVGLLTDDKTATPTWVHVASSEDIAAPLEEVDRVILKMFKECLQNANVSHFALKDISGATALLVTPAPSKGQRLPLVAYIHGGPHALSPDSFSAQIAVFLALGFAVLLPNYRGSVSFGEDFAEELLGHIGSKDVDDCANLVRRALELHPDILDPGAVAAYGASHGGFLTCWLVGHSVHRKLFKTGVAWNPVTNVPAMVATSDIPDWAVAEGLRRPADKIWPLSGEDMAQLYKASPISVAQNVACPLLVVLGSADKRVPALSQGREYVAAIKHARLRADVKRTAPEAPLVTYQYPGEGHALLGPEANAHVLATIANWLVEQLQSDQAKVLI